MPNLNNIKDTLTIVDAAADVLKSDAVKTIAGHASTALGHAQRYNQTGGSLSQFTAQTTLISSVYIDESILNEMVIPNLLRAEHTWYGAQIIAALQLQQMVDDKRNVQDYVRILQTGQNARQQSTADNAVGYYKDYRSRRMAQESFLENYLGEVGTEAFASRPGSGRPAPYRGKAAASKETASSEGKEKDETMRFVSLKSVNPSENRIGPIGELFEITLSNPSNKDASVKVPVFVQMQPKIIPQAVAPRFIDMNVSPSIWHRWLQRSAGEITFFRDFLFKRDLIKRRLAVVKDPQAAAAFSDFLKTVAKKDAYALGDLTSRDVSTNSMNLANSVIILSEDTVAQAMADSGINLHNPKDRQRYFSSAYAMSLVIVDPLHQRLTIAFNGIDGELDCSYADFKPKDDKFEPKDFMQAMAAFATNNIGRMR